MKRILLCIILLLGCTPKMVLPTLAEDLCSWNESYEYVCYNKAECRAYMNGYAAVLRERFDAQGEGWFKDGNPDVQRVNINLFMDEYGWYLYGYYIATRHGNRVWIDTTTWICDIEGNVVAPKATLGDWAEWRVE